MRYKSYIYTIPSLAFHQRRLTGSGYRRLAERLVERLVAKLSATL
jgi:hypothetical protein